MSGMRDIVSQHWFEQIPDRPRHLLILALDLHEREQAQTSDLYDYSYVVFPAAKAYEGFLKYYFFTQGLITKKTYEGKRFRIGRALNPDLHPNGQDEYWLYDDISKRCGAEVARELWDTWLTCRNQVFHFFPNKENPLSLDQARLKLEQVLSTLRVLILCSA